MANFEITVIGDSDLPFDQAYGGELVKYYMVRWFNLYEESELREMLHEAFPAIHCQHSYDCCGNYYPSAGNILKVDMIYEYAIVEVKFTQNV